MFYYPLMFRMFKKSRHMQTWAKLKNATSGIRTLDPRSGPECSRQSCQGGGKSEHFLNCIIGVTCYKLWALPHRGLSPKGIECPPPPNAKVLFFLSRCGPTYILLPTQYVIKLHILSRFLDSRCGLALNLSLFSKSVCEFGYTMPLRKIKTHFNFI